VPAAAVIRGGQVLFVRTGRKGFVGDFRSFNDINWVTFFRGYHFNTLNLGIVKDCGTFNGEVKFRDIDRDHHKVQTAVSNYHRR